MSIDGYPEDVGASGRVLRREALGGLLGCYHRETAHQGWTE